MTLRFDELTAMARANDPAFREVPREECVAAARAYALERRTAIRERHAAGESGLDVVRALAETADLLLRGIFEFGLYTVANRSALMSRVALCALGGYGRAELSPCSDLDVCLLYDGVLDGHIKDLNAYVVPFLWDTGFVLNYSIRSVNEAVELATADLKVYTCILESRLITGDSTTFARLKLNLREAFRGDDEASAAFIRAKTAARYAELEPEYRDLYKAEPNIKENRGGLRDFHTALWILMMTYGPLTLDDVAALGIVSPQEHLDVVQGIDFIWRIRNELHFTAGREDDRLTFDNQKRVAAAFGYGHGSEDDTHRLMQDYYAAARKLHRFLHIAALTCNQHPEMGAVEATVLSPRAQILVHDGQLEAGGEDPCWFAEQPSRLMEVFWECARRMVPLSRATERRIHANLHLVTDTFRANDLVRRFFIAICNRPTQAGFALRQAAHRGLLGRYLPEFAAIQGRICYEDFHHFPVDEHTLRAIEALADLRNMKGPAAECLHNALEHLPDPYILVMAILFHDLGKVEGETHVQAGVAAAKTICARIGMPPEDTELIAFLVEHHLDMTNLSQYRDIDDPHIVQEFARTMKTEERLRLLFLLSYADLAAVGPGVWNDWKGALLLKLYLKTEMILLGRAKITGEEYWKSPKAAEVRDLLTNGLQGEIEPHLRGLGDRYLLAFSPKHIAMHIECASLARERGLAVNCWTHEETGMSEIVVCTADRPGLFSMIAGSFASELIDVNNAALFTRADGIVVDCFTVSDAAQGRPLTDRQFKAFERALRAVLIEGADIRDLVDRSRRRLFALLQPRIPVRTRISFDNESSLTHTVIDIETGDRTGLLYDITRAMAHAGLDISTACIVTDARRVRDSFYVTLEKGKIETEEKQDEFREVLHEAIHPRALAENR
ncbi:MAG TPA: [protein-PII] uridylyltransferase [Candidatus Hydrogenedentes bacterium]|nr:[protein-PII] uridylyltransferase [Candidatus Hydrogenedentota bacterium]HRT19905.1 [protein-PII] uridylyltransferase [Candidatus Hydrogenedentota bacterium]HRT66334.1 [protein-PII] uridylyltransferase [Candidatus Hydrogenedentota bacterium]